MASTLDLTTARTRVRDVLMDADALLWANGQLDQAARQALEEYSQAALDPRTRPEPHAVIASMVPAAGRREQDLSELPGLLGVTQVWFPYTSASPEDPPRVIAFRFYRDGTTPRLYLEGPLLPDGVTTARVFYLKLHTLAGLDGASVSSFAPGDDNLIVMGAAGYACGMRAVNLNETASNMAVSTPNYAALGELLLSEFRAALAPRRIVIARPLPFGRG